MLLTCVVRSAAARAASSVLLLDRGVAVVALADTASQRLSPRFGSTTVYRELSTSAKKSPQSDDNRPLQKGTDVRTAFYGELDPRVAELLELIEQSREEGASEQELEQSLELYDILKQRQQQDTDVFEVAFGIARIYDDQLEDGETATKYYEEALKILEAMSTEAAVWGACMRVTTLGALAVCFEKLGQPEEAGKYFEDAIGAYEEHCEQAPVSGTEETNVSNSDISLLTDLNATAAMIHYHYAGNLLAQDRCDEAKNVTKIALVLADNSSMPAEELEEMQQCIHDLWMEID